MKLVLITKSNRYQRYQLDKYERLGNKNHNINIISSSSQS